MLVSFMPSLRRSSSPCSEISDAIENLRSGVNLEELEMEPKEDPETTEADLDFTENRAPFLSLVISFESPSLDKLVIVWRYALATSEFVEDEGVVPGGMPARTEI